MTKTCSKCCMDLPLGNFYRRSDSPNKTHALCKACHIHAANERYARKRDEILEYKREWTAANPEKQKKKNQLFRQMNPDYQVRKYHADPMYRLKCRMRARIRRAVTCSGFRKNSRTKDIVGCDLIFLRRHLESQFSIGMTWENMGKWHIDHKLPLSSAADEEQLLKLCHYTNLQPLWATDNLRKGARL